MGVFGKDWEGLGRVEQLTVFDQMIISARVAISHVSFITGQLKIGIQSGLRNQTAAALARA